MLNEIKQCLGLLYKHKLAVYNKRLDIYATLHPGLKGVWNFSPSSLTIGDFFEEQIPEGLLKKLGTLSSDWSFVDEQEIVKRVRATLGNNPETWPVIGRKCSFLDREVPFALLSNKTVPFARLVASHFGNCSLHIARTLIKESAIGVVDVYKSEISDSSIKNLSVCRPFDFFTGVNAYSERKLLDETLLLKTKYSHISNKAWGEYFYLQRLLDGLKLFLQNNTKYLNKKFIREVNHTFLKLASRRKFANSKELLDFVCVAEEEIYQVLSNVAKVRNLFRNTFIRHKIYLTKPITISADCESFDDITNLKHPPLKNFLLNFLLCPIDRGLAGFWHEDNLFFVMYNRSKASVVLGTRNYNSFDEAAKVYHNATKVWKRSPRY